MDPVITNIDIGEAFLKDGVFENETLTHGGAGTILKGTILARHSSNGKLIPYVIGGSSNGNGVPKAILMHDSVAAGSGDKPVRVAVQGQFVKDKLIVDADGDDSNITSAILDSLRLYGLNAQGTAETELNNLDNQ